MELNWILAAVGLAGLLVFVFGARRVRHGRIFAGSLQGIVGLALISLAALAYVAATGLYGYQRFTHETPVADLHFKQSGPQRFRLLFTPEHGTSQVLELEGDEWQLDARVLKITAFATLIGLDGAYRLERLTGRYRDVNQERRVTRTMHALYGKKQTIDTWILVQRFGDWLPLVDATYGNAVWLPMADGVRYEVHIGVNGLIARPKKI